MSLLVTHDVTARFGAQVAVHPITCAFAPGSFCALVGANGAGKTTFLDLLGGQLRPSGGRIAFNSLDLTPLDAAARARAGLARSFQHPELFAGLSVQDHVQLALQAPSAHPVAAATAQWFQRWRAPSAQGRCHPLLANVGLKDKAFLPAACLHPGERRRLELAILMARPAQVLLLDEPTAGVGAQDMASVLDLLRRLKADGTKTVLMVEHHLDVVRELADRVLVMHNGELIADGPPAEVLPLAEAADATPAYGVELA